MPDRASSPACAALRRSCCATRRCSSWSACICAARLASSASLCRPSRSFWPLASRSLFASRASSLAAFFCRPCSATSSQSWCTVRIFISAASRASRSRLSSARRALRATCSSSPARRARRLRSRSSHSIACSRTIRSTSSPVFCASSRFSSAIVCLKGALASSWRLISRVRCFRRPCCLLCLWSSSSTNFLGSNSRSRRVLSTDSVHIARGT
mmetsp:Transcript_50975/g.143489  ORF Transcript_50975/g.143489 Transcript_50975/m.143489 type:complete len:212 (-) Transcript_50975:215-850(-)